MNLINNIISEEINKFVSHVINENNAAIFQILEKYRVDISSRYQNLEESIEKYKALKNNEIDNFINNLCTFTIQLENALARCVSKQSLNESLRDWGITPPPQFANIANDFKYWYNWSNRNIFGKQGYGSYGNTANGKRNFQSAKNVKNEKLSVLLSNSLYKIENQYNLIANKYGNAFIQISNAPANIIQDAKEITVAIQRNAQGTNP
jgi:hypothetical protein